MKNLILIAVLSLSFSVSNFANTNPIDNGDEVSIMLTNDQVTCSISMSAMSLINVSYSEDSSELYYETVGSVSFIQVLNADGELIYQLPIGGSKVYLALDDFDKGEYNLNFMLEDTSTFVSTTVTKK